MTSLRTAIVVPAAPGLLPPAGLVDPFEEARAAALAALRGALPAESVAVIGAVPVGSSLLEEAGHDGALVDPAEAELVVVAADGSAKRSEKAPGHLDERSFVFDELIEAALAAGDGAALTRLDPALAEDLWCSGVPAFAELGRLLPSADAVLNWSGDPYGVAYWVATWTNRT